MTAQTLNAAASGTSTSANGSASIQNLDAILSTAGVAFPLVELTATTIAAMAAADAGGVTGSATLQGVALSGSLVGAPITFDIPATLPANGIVFNAGGVEIILNEQTTVPGGITVNAVDLILNNASYLGSTPVSGNLILSQSQAQVFGRAAVPEPAAWVEMILGFGISGPSPAAGGRSSGPDAGLPRPPGPPRLPPSAPGGRGGLCPLSCTSPQTGRDPTTVTRSIRRTAGQ